MVFNVTMSGGPTVSGTPVVTRTVLSTAGVAGEGIVARSVANTPAPSDPRVAHPPPRLAREGVLVAARLTTRPPSL